VRDEGRVRVPVKPVQDIKAPPPIEVTDVGIKTEVKPLQSANVCTPIDVRDEGRERVPVKPVQDSKALPPMEVTDEGVVKVTAFKPLQYPKALVPIEVTDEGIVNIPVKLKQL
jgi:hypothetical protein